MAELTVEKIEDIVRRAVDMFLSSKTGQSSLRNEYVPVFRSNYGKPEIYILFRTPVREIPQQLYYDLYQILYYVLFPAYTVIRPTSVQIRSFDGIHDFSLKRGLWFPLRKGTPKRITMNMNEYLSQISIDHLLFMHGFAIDLTKTPHIILTGQTGSGKSTAETVILSAALHIDAANHGQNIVCIDPKVSSLARFCRRYPGIRLLVPQSNERPEDFLQRVNDVLSECNKNMTNIQQQIFEQTNKITADYRSISSPDKFIIIDELAALVAGLGTGAKGLVADFNALLLRLVLCSREAGYHVILSCQEARATQIPTDVRAQMTVRILLGNLDRNSTQFLFGDALNDGGIPLPFQQNEKGAGIISVSDPNFLGVEPILMPTITDLEE